MAHEPPSSTDPLEVAKFFWNEYRYRHDLIWKRIVLLTTAIVFISICPYLNPKIAIVLNNWILLAPILAYLLDVFVILVMRNELGTFRRIKEAYRREQNKLLDPDLKHTLNKESQFEMFVIGYLILLGLLTLANGIIIWQIWLPGLAC